MCTKAKQVEKAVVPEKGKTEDKKTPSLVESNSKGWYVLPNDDGRYPHEYLTREGTITKSTEGAASTSWPGYFPNRAEAEAALKKFQAQQQGVFAVPKGEFIDSTKPQPPYDTPELIPFQVKGTASGRIQTAKPNFTEVDKVQPFGGSAAKVLHDADVINKQQVGMLLEKLNELRLNHVREDAHVQLLLEKDDVPEVTPVRARLVTDGHRIVLELLTPGQIPVAVARLEVKKGKVVMYRERGVDSPFVKTDSQGRIQN